MACISGYFCLYKFDWYFFVSSIYFIDKLWMYTFIHKQFWADFYFLNSNVCVLWGLNFKRHFLLKAWQRKPLGPQQLHPPRYRSNHHRGRFIAASYLPHPPLSLAHVEITGFAEKTRNYILGHGMIDRRQNGIEVAVIEILRI